MSPQSLWANKFSEKNKQYQLYQSYAVDVFVRTAIKMHLKSQNLPFHMAFMLLR